MKAAIDALVTVVKGVSALSAWSGPYWEIAPEATPFPYTTISQVGGLSNLYGIGNTGTYIEPLHIQIHLFHTNLETLSTTAETLCNSLDYATLTISGQQCRNIQRLEALRVMADPVSGSGVRVYHGLLQYRMNVQRTVGS